MNENIKGLGVALITPFNAQKEVDFPALKRITNHVIEGGVDFLVVLGTTGETPTLSEKEQMEVITAVIQENKGRLPIVIGCGGNHTTSVAKKMQELEGNFSPDAFLSSTPHYNKPSQEGIFQHFLTLAEDIHTPILLYNVPGRTASDMLPPTVLRLSQSHPNLAGIKESSPDLFRMYGYLDSQFRVLSGDDIAAFYVLLGGAEGLISVLANALPREMKLLVDHCLKGEVNLARKIFRALIPIINLCFEEGNPAGIKGLLTELDLIDNHLRLPLTHCSNELQSKLKKELNRISNSF